VLRVNETFFMEVFFEFSYCKIICFHVTEEYNVAFGILCAKGKKKKNGNENSFFAAVGKIDKESLKLKDSLKSFF
jgi:hypothetical protein